MLLIVEPSLQHSACVHVSVCVYVCAHTLVCMCVCVHASVCVCVYVCTGVSLHIPYVCQCLWKLENGVKFPKVALTSGCEWPNVGAGN